MSGARGVFAVVGAAALLAGLYGRFKGLGTWPLGVDEFYISRSIDNVLQSGLPRFPCGGYYTRGLMFQYLVAGLRSLGWTPEFAGRFVAAVSSLAVLPAAYLLARRVRGSLAGWLVVVILCISVWEIEMARFARMYAPFQAVFAWYLVFYLRYTIDRRGAALGWMAVLSVLGVLTWEGGALLGLANLIAIVQLHENGRLRRGDWLRLALLIALLGGLYEATRDLRGFADLPMTAGALPEEPAPHGVAAWFAPLAQHPLWALGLLVPLALSVPALRWIGTLRERWIAAAGLAAALLAAAVHAFVGTAAALVLLLLLGLMDREALSWRRARYFWLALGAFFLFWLLCEAASMAGGFASKAGAAALAQHLLGFPDVFGAIVRPWGRALPVLSLGLCAAVAYLFWLSISERDPDTRDAAVLQPVAVLLTLIIIMVLAVGATPTERIETRYTFFLYPPLIVLAVCALLTFLQRQRQLRKAPILITAAVPLLCFAATEDFQPRHVLDVDSARINFRVGMSAVRAAHYYPRNDMRVVAQWLAAQVRPGDVVITGIPSLDQYDPRIDYFFLNEGDSRYESYVCSDDMTERWTNHPVLYTLEAIKPIVASGHRVFAIVYQADEERLAAYAPAAGWSIARQTAGTVSKTTVLVVATRSEAM